MNIIKWIREQCGLGSGRAVNTPLSLKKEVISRAEHGISRAQISPNALKVLHRLHKAGFEAYLVGGSVRDLLLQRAPKDFDVATSAHPEAVRRLFSNCRLIGRRFRLAHVFFGPEIIEVATFRAHHSETHTPQQAQVRNGQIIRDNVYGTLEEDAERRDFTINALYYNHADGSVIDFNRGMEDIKNNIIRILGDPLQRYREDPVRMLRAIRFAVKTGFQIEPVTEKPLFTEGHLLQNVPQARLFEETCKLLLSGQSVAAFAKLETYNIFRYLFPETDKTIHLTTTNTDEQTVLYNRRLIERTLSNTDDRISKDKPITPAFLLAALLWPVLQNNLTPLKDSMPILAALEIAMNRTVDSQLSVFSIQKRFTLMMREIWQMQYQLQATYRAPYLLSRLKFRAGFDFLSLRAQSGETELTPLVDWWTEYQNADQTKREAMLAELPKPKRRRKRRRKKSV
ncbi:MAG: polynucleotide adenylyltransferase [Gammaproteobacteria bacterium]|nr:polynucleotide adenylyltransferase [Gammaproteobacteria bacterium]